MDFKNGWQRWLDISQKAANILGRIVITIFYFTLMLPFSIGVTLFGDPLMLKQSPSRYWDTREDTNNDLAAARQQF